MKAVEAAEMMLLGEISGAAVDRLADLDRQIPWPLPLEVGLGPIVPGGRQPSLASLASERSPRFGVGHDGGRHELGAFDELPNERRTFLLDVELDQAARVEVSDQRRPSSTISDVVFFPFSTAGFALP